MTNTRLKLITNRTGFLSIRSALIESWYRMDSGVNRTKPTLQWKDQLNTTLKRACTWYPVSLGTDGKHIQPQKFRSLENVTNILYPCILHKKIIREPKYFNLFLSKYYSILLFYYFTILRLLICIQPLLCPHSVWWVPALESAKASP